MYTAKNVSGLLLAAAFVFAGMLTTFGQTESRQLDESYQVSLQFVMGSNESGKSELPASLTGITRELKNNFGFSNYRVAGTLLGRVGSNGNYEYKSVSSIFGMETVSTTPTFLEWTLQGLHGGKGTAVEGSSFRFGARVPILSQRDDGKGQTVSYEPVGIVAARFAVPENTPTLIGTLSLPNTPGTVFLVMTARVID